MTDTTSGMAGARDVDADAIVIGAGASGLCAAITLSLGGASVLIFEQMPECGGMTNHAEGMFAVGSKLQKMNKVGLTVDEAFKVHMEETHWLANARLVKNFMEKSGSTIDWLEELGANFSGLFTISPYTPRVWHQFAGFAKEGLIEPLHAKVRAEKNIRLFLETPVKSLMMEEGRVAGIVAEDRDGNTVRAKAKVVIIASGGYQDNEEWVNQYCKSGFTRPVVPSKQTGGPIRMAWDVGAEPYDLGVMQTIVLVPEEELTSQLLVAGFQPRLWINLLGERFCDESICWKFPMAGNALARQPNATAFCIFDEDTKTFMRERGVRYVLGEFYDISKRLADIDSELERGIEEGKVFRGSSLEALAERIGVEGQALRATVDEYNACCDRNYDFVFAKDRTYLQAIRSPEYYAVRLGLAAFMTNGGIRINHRTEVLKKDREAIPGLYAVGCCAGGLLGDTYEVSTTGGSLSFAVNSGRMAGENALHYLEKR
jgi:fumarate reductase flavoprotein subunit